MINSSLINSFLINAAALSGLDEVLTDGLNINNTFVIQSYLGIKSSINLSTQLTYRETLNITENLITTVLIGSTQLTSESVVELLEFRDSLKVAYFETVTESQSIVDNVLTLKAHVEKVLSSIKVIDSGSSKALFLANLINQLQLTDRALYGVSEEIFDLIILSPIVSSLYKAIIESIDNILLSTDSNIYLIQTDEILDQLTVGAYTESIAILKELLEDTFIIRLPIDSSGKYNTYLLAPENKAITSYTNFNFDKSTIFNGKYLFINETGLFEYGGVEDDLSPIKAWVETSAIDFGTSNLKNIPNIYLACSMDDVLYLKVRVDGKGEMVYRLNKHTENQQNHKINVGKGLTGRYFQFDLITESENFSLENIEFLPMIMRRKL